MVVGGPLVISVRKRKSELPWQLSGKKIRRPMQEMQVRSLGWEYPLEKEIATHSSILAWGIA